MCDYNIPEGEEQEREQQDYDFYLMDEDLPLMKRKKTMDNPHLLSALYELQRAEINLLNDPDNALYYIETIALLVAEYHSMLLEYKNNLETASNIIPFKKVETWIH